MVTYGLNQPKIKEFRDCLAHECAANAKGLGNHILSHGALVKC